MYECTIYIENAEIKIEYYSNSIFDAVDEIESCIVSILTSDICRGIEEAAKYRLYYSWWAKDTKTGVYAWKNVCYARKLHCIR